MTSRSLLTILILLSCVTYQAEGGLVLDVSSTTITAGGSGYIDITIKSDGTPTTLGEFNFDVYIDGSKTRNSPALTFSNLSDLAYRTDAGAKPPYVFLNDSSGGAVAYSNPSPPNAGLHQEVGGGDFIDFVNSSSDVTISGHSTYLLAQLDVSASSLAQVGDVYSIRVVATSDPTTSPTGYSGVFSDTPPSLFTLDPNNTPSVTIGPAVAVPEPSALLLSIVGMACLMAHRLRPRRLLTVLQRTFT